MTTESKRKFNSRNEEVPVASNFVVNSLERDLNDFSIYKGIDSIYVKDFRDKIAAVRMVVLPVTLTARGAAVSQRMLTNMLGMRTDLDTLENFLRNVGDENLTVPVKSFGVSEARSAINNQDAERLDNALQGLISNVKNNMVALKAAGYTDADLAALERERSEIFDDNSVQRSIDSERAQLVNDNLGLLNDLYTNYAIRICKLGRNHYKTRNPSKLNDYSYSYLIRTMRNDASKTWLEGQVKRADGSVAAKAAVTLIPVNGGRKRKVKTDDKGHFEIKNLSGETYTLMVVLGSESKVDTLVFETAEHKVIEVALEESKK